MDVINKLYSSVSSTVSQLSGVLPGNPVTREFDAIEHIASAGPGLQWKIYRGFKKSTKQEAAIFVFEKKHLERWSRDDREMMLETLKRGVTQLTKIRHPHILTVQHALEESRESLAFATEPIFASLANVLGNKTNMPQPAPVAIDNYKLHEVEIKYGLQQICEGLVFLHSDVKLLHRNICPESIIVNQLGAWKIFGFDFCIVNSNKQDLQPFWPFSEYNVTWHRLNQPNLDYLAPEYALIASHSASSDIYSLGMMIYALYEPAGKPVKLFDDYGQFKNYAKELKQGKHIDLSCVVQDLREYVKLMLHTTPEMRPDLHQLTKVSYFDDIGVKTLSYLDSLFQWDNLQKSKFYKGLPQIIQKLPHRICIYRILPCLVKEFVNPAMVPFVLPNVLLIAENSTKDEYVKHILMFLKPVMKMQNPIQILLIFMQRMELLLKLTPPDEIISDVLPMLYRALESDTQQIQELCLSVLPTFASLIDYTTTKNALLPRIKKLCIRTQFISVRVNCLLCIGKLLEHLDKWLVLDEILPFLPSVPSKEPAVLMGILGIYKLALINSKLGITKELMANNIIPFLVPLCIENGLTLNQFNALISLVKEMLMYVEQEHRGKLQQLNSIQQEHSFDTNVSAASGPLIPTIPPPLSKMDQMFSNLGLEDYVNNSAMHGGSNIHMSDVKTTDTMEQLSSSRSKILTLQDKQRIVTQQEAAQRQQSQNIFPKKSSSTNSMNHLTQITQNDATTSLMHNNLDQIMKNKLKTNITGQPPGCNAVNYNLSICSQTARQPSEYQINSNSNNRTNNFHANLGNRQFASSNMETSSNNMNSFSRSMTMMNQRILTNPQNCNNSSLSSDSLLNNDSMVFGDLFSSNNKIPLNQITNTNQPLLNTTPVAKSLTKEDIFDLLS